MVDGTEAEIIRLYQEGAKLLAWSEIAGLENEVRAEVWLRESGHSAIRRAAQLRHELDEASSRESAQQLAIPS